MLEKKYLRLVNQPAMWFRYFTLGDIFIAGLGVILFFGISSSFLVLVVWLGLYLLFVLGLRVGRPLGNHMHLFKALTSPPNMRTGTEAPPFIFCTTPVESEGFEAVQRRAYEQGIIIARTPSFAVITREEMDEESFKLLAREVLPHAE